MAIIHNLIARFRADTGAFDRNIKKSRSEMTRFGKDIQGMGRQLLAVAGIGGGIYMLKRGLESVTRAAAIQQRAERDLMAATQGNIESFKKFAAEIQRVTVYGDEMILSQMAYLKNMGLTTSELENATKAAIGLAATYNKDLPVAMRLVALAAKGETGQLKEMGIVIDKNLSAFEKYNKLVEMGAEGFRLAEERARDSLGTWARFKNVMSDVAEKIGGPLLDNFTRGLEKTIEWTEQIKEFNKEVEKTREQHLQFEMLPQGGVLGGAGLFAEELRKEDEELVKFQQKWRSSFDDMSRQMAIQSQEYKNAEEISSKYIDRIKEEIALTGLVGDARQHAAQVIRMETELKKADLKNTHAYTAEVKKLKAALTELEQVQKLARIAEDIGESFAGAFEDMVFEAKKFGDVMKSLLRDISRSVFKNLFTVPLANQITMALGGTPATVMHGGGLVGSAGTKRNVNPMLFAGAPRLHKGLMSDEMPAILQRGEQVVPRGGGMMAPTINIYNESGTQIGQKGQPFFDGKKWIISVVAEDVNTGGTLRKLLGIKR